MTFSVLRSALTWGLLLILGGCASTWSDPGSWFGRNVAQNSQASQTGEAPPPKASPAEPVEAHLLPPPQAPSSFTAPSPGAVQIKAAILLPLSGKNANLGKAMLNAAQMAVFDMSGGNFELMPRDTGGDDSQAMTAARDAIGSGAQLLIGPLFSTQVLGVRSVAEPGGTSMLALSTDTSFAAPGVFVMGFAPGAQVERVVSFAAAKGLKRFAALVPDNAYGALVAQAFRVAVTRAGGVVADLETYDPSQHNGGAAIATLAKYRDRIDALFLPAGGPDLEKIAEQLKGAGFDNHQVRLLGTGLWDEADLGSRAEFLVGGWYAAPDPSARRNFINVYTRSYGQEPPRLATLAYDATALAAVLARRGDRFDRPSLTNPNGFAGVDGIFRLTDQGLVERGLAVDEVAPGGSRVVSPAPVTFAAAKTL